MRSQPWYIIAFGLLASPVNAWAAKVDTVHLVNGDAITGEINSLEFGSLSYGTDSMGTVTIDWEDVTTIQTPHTLQIELTDGTRYFGRLGATDDQYRVTVITGAAEVELGTDEIVRMTAIDTEEDFLSRIDGSIKFGATSERASEVTTINLATDLEYRSRRFLVGLTANASFTDQPSEETTQRTNVALNYQRFRENRWFADWFSNWETNEQLGIANRFILGGGLGRYIIQTNLDQFSMTLGVNATRESFVDDTEKGTTVAEGRLQLRYLHRRVEPEAYLSFKTNIYPLLSNPSDYRAESDLTWRREFIDDLFFDITVYHSYQSEPTADAESVDYGVTTSLGYSF
jgi:putative salt-induced outer membrane protein YdiY